jgi:hypothetical protein
MPLFVVFVVVAATVVMMILHQVHTGGGSHFELMRRALCIFAPRPTPNKLLLTAVTLFSRVHFAALPLAQAAEQHQHAFPNGLGLRDALKASLDHISTH